MLLLGVKQTHSGCQGRMSLFLGCFGEAKVPVGRLEVQSVLQPMFEVMVAAELAIFENDMVPLVNIMGNKTAFMIRPILYWIFLSPRQM